MTETRFPLEPIETASQDELRALQLRRLQSTLRQAYANSPVYRAKFDAVGVHPDDCRSLSDLAKFPFTSKKDLRESYPFGLFAVPRAQCVRIHASSGTTGKPTVVGYTRNDIETWSHCVARSIRAAGARPGDMVHVSYGYGLFTGGLGAHYGAERLGLTVVPFGGGQTERQVQLITDFRPDIVMVTPSYMLAIADEFEKQGLDPAQSSLRIGIFGAEPWTNDMRRTIERRMGLDAVDIYGLSEVMGPGVASECAETKDGPTIWEDHFYPEIVDPATGAPLPAGEVGEVWCRGETVMMGYYKDPEATAAAITPEGWLRTGDLGVFDAQGFLKITGRLKEMFKSGGTNVYPVEIEQHLARHPAVRMAAVIGVPDERWGESVKAFVVRKKDAAVSEGELITFLRERIAGYKVPRSVEILEQLPRNPTGKILKRELRKAYWGERERQVN